MNRRFVFWVGYLVAACTVLVGVAELASFVALGLYYGSYQRLSRIAPELGFHEPDHRIFSTHNLVGNDVRRASGVYAGQPWADEFLKEADTILAAWPLRYEPFRVWGNAEVHGKYINVDTTETGIWRRTINHCAPESSSAVRVWLFGGSTLVGVETPDFATIPSSLAVTLSAQGDRCIAVTNLGVLGYVINQETILLTDLLKRGHRPDIVIFLDGANDAYVGAFSPALPTAHGDLEDIRRRVEGTAGPALLLERSYTLRVLAGMARHAMPSAPETTADLVPDDTIRRRAQQTLTNYEANLALVRTLAGAYGFTAYFFWQPTLVFGEGRGTAFERLFRDHPAFSDPAENRATTAVYDEAEHRAKSTGEFMFLGHVFDGVPGPIYTDQVHLGPRGNAVLADAMAQTVRIR